MTQSTNNAQRQSHEALVVQQFGSQASAYVASTVHAQGADLQQMIEIAARMPKARAIDLGCGGGHVSYGVAPVVASVVAYDLSAGMLEAAAAEAVARGFGNLTTKQGAAEKLPFADGEFDIVLSRYSAHHWQNVRQGVREARRVLKTGGTAVISDIIAPEVPVSDTFLQTFEMLRDPRDHRSDPRLLRPIDVLMMSIGGNDTGFSGTLSDMTTEQVVIGWVWKTGATQAEIKARTKKVLAALPAKYDKLDAIIRKKLRPKAMLIQEP